MVLHHVLADGHDVIGVHQTNTSRKYTYGLIPFIRGLLLPSPTSRTWSCIILLLLPRRRSRFNDAIANKGGLLRHHRRNQESTPTIPGWPTKAVVSLSVPLRRLRWLERYLKKKRSLERRHPSWPWSSSQAAAWHEHHGMRTTSGLLSSIPTVRSALY
jgi:hypothetical protein